MASQTVPEQDEPQTGFEKQDNAITGGTNPVVGTFEKAYEWLLLEARETSEEGVVDEVNFCR